MYKPEKVRIAYIQNDGLIITDSEALYMGGTKMNPTIYLNVWSNDIFTHNFGYLVFNHNFRKHVHEHRIKLIDQYELSRINLKVSEDSFIDHVNGLL